MLAPAVPGALVAGAAVPLVRVELAVPKSDARESSGPPYSEGMMGHRAFAASIADRMGWPLTYCFRAAGVIAAPGTCVSPDERKNSERGRGRRCQKLKCEQWKRCTSTWDCPSLRTWLCAEPARLHRGGQRDEQRVEERGGEVRVPRVHARAHVHDEFDVGDLDSRDQRLRNLRGEQQWQ